jgi:hypothetical protein
MMTRKSCCAAVLGILVLVGATAPEAAAHEYNIGKGKKSSIVHPGDTLHLAVGDTLILNVVDKNCKAILTPSIGSTAIATFTKEGEVEAANRTYKIKGVSAGQTNFTLKVVGTEPINPDDDDIDCPEDSTNVFTICVGPNVKAMVKSYTQLAKQKKKELRKKLKDLEKKLKDGYKVVTDQVKAGDITVCQAQTMMAMSMATETGGLNDCWSKLADEIAAFGMAQVADAGYPKCAKLDAAYSTGSDGVHDQFNDDATKCLRDSYEKMRKTFRTARNATENLRPDQSGASILMTPPAVIGGPAGPSNTQGLPPALKAISVASTIATPTNIGLADGVITLIGFGEPSLGPVLVRVHGSGVDTTVMAAINPLTCQWVATIPDLPVGLYGIEARYDGDEHSYSSFISVNQS